MTKNVPKPKAPGFAKTPAETRRIVAHVKRLRDEIEDLQDSLLLIEARARDNGKRYTAEEARARLGLK